MEIKYTLKINIWLIYCTFWKLLRGTANIIELFVMLAFVSLMFHGVGSLKH